FLLLLRHPEKLSVHRHHRAIHLAGVGAVVYAEPRARARDMAARLRGTRGRNGQRPGHWDLSQRDQAGMAGHWLIAAGRVFVFFLQRPGPRPGEAAGSLAGNYVWIVGGVAVLDG